MKRKKIPSYKMRKKITAKCCGTKYRRGQGKIVNGICYKCREKIIPKYEPDSNLLKG